MKLLKHVTNNNRLANALLRIGLAAVLLYAGISALVNPNEWLGYLPHLLTSYVPATVLLRMFSLYEIGLALWLLSGKFTRYAAALAALTFTGIVLSNLGDLLLTFRDVAMVFAALALAVLKID